MSIKTIGEKTIDEINGLERSLLETSQGDLDAAYKRTPGSLKIDIGVTVSPDSGINDIKSVIKFNTSERYALDYTSKVSEDQMELFEEEDDGRLL